MLFANNCNTTLNGAITAVATSMVVTSATGFPVPTGSQYFYCTLADAATQTTIEIVKVTAVSGNTFTIVRGQDGTSGTAFSSGAVVSLRLVRASLNDFPKLDENNTFTFAPTFNTALAVGSGGTGLTSLTTGYIPYGNGASAFSSSANLTFDGTSLSVGGTPYSSASFSSRYTTPTGGNAKTILGATDGTNAYGLFHTGPSYSFAGVSGNELWYYSTGYSALTFGSDTGIPVKYIYSGSERMRIQSGVSIGNTTDPGAGNLNVTGTGKFGTTVGVGAATPAASGAGITFPATQSASTDANTLDDYEEGTWTPNFSGWFTAPSVTYAKYTKIGRTVNLNILCQGGVTVGGDVIGSLPFTSAGGQGASAVIRGINTNINAVGAIPDGSTQIQNIGAMTNTGLYWVLSTCYIV